MGPSLSSSDHTFRGPSDDLLRRLFGKDDELDTLSADNEISEGALQQYINSRIVSLLYECTRDVSNDSSEPNGAMVFDNESIAGDVLLDGFELESRSNFGSVRTIGGVSKGKWQYEVILGTSRIQQLGWCTIETPFTNEAGVGDSDDSYAYDGHRMKKWNREDQAYGEEWTDGDVIGCCLDLEDLTVSFYRNGASMGVAYRGIQRAMYYPAVSLSCGERCEVNFGERPFLYPSKGYSPMVKPPAENAAACFVFTSLDRLLAMMWALPETPDTCQDAAPPVSTALKAVSKVLIASLAPFLETEYVQVAALLPFLQDLLDQGNHVLKHGAQLLMSSLRALRGDAFTSRVFQTVFRALARKCRSTPILKSVPAAENGPLPSLRLANALLELTEVQRAWLDGPYWRETMEGLLSVKEPSAQDKRQLIPCVWWQGACPVANLPIEEEGYVQCVQWLHEVMDRIEEAQLRLCSLLLSTPPRRWHQPGGRGEDVVQPPDCFNDFLSYLVKKNQGAVRNILPPGLSNNSTMLATFFVTLRLLQPHLKEASCPSSLLGTFPAGQLFLQGVRPPGHPAPPMLMPDRYHGAQRLGGTIGHLAKECPPQYGDRTASFSLSRALTPLFSVRDSTWVVDAAPSGQASSRPTSRPPSRTSSEVFASPAGSSAALSDSSEADQASAASFPSDAAPAWGTADPPGLHGESDAAPAWVTANLAGLLGETAQAILSSAPLLQRAGQPALASGTAEASGWGPASASSAAPGLEEAASPQSSIRVWGAEQPALASETTEASGWGPARQDALAQLEMFVDERHTVGNQQLTLAASGSPAREGSGARSASGETREEPGREGRGARSASEVGREGSGSRSASEGMREEPGREGSGARSISEETREGAASGTGEGVSESPSPSPVATSAAPADAQPLRLVEGVPERGLAAVLPSHLENRVSLRAGGTPEALTASALMPQAPPRDVSPLLPGAPPLEPPTVRSETWPGHLGPEAADAGAASARRPPGSSPQPRTPPPYGPRVLPHVFFSPLDVEYADEGEAGLGPGASSSSSNGDGSLAREPGSGCSPRLPPPRPGETEGDRDIRQHLLNCHCTGSPKVSAQQAAQLLDAALSFYHLSLVATLSKAVARHEAELECLVAEWGQSRLALARAEEAATASIAIGCPNQVEPLRDCLSDAARKLADCVCTSAWFEVTLCGQRKMNGILLMASYVARLLSVVAGKVSVFSYVPEFYLEVLLSSFSRVRFTASMNLQTAWDCLLNHTINFLAMHFDNTAIVNPDMHGAMLTSLSQLVKRRGGMEVFQDNRTARQRLVPALVSSFAQGKHWCIVCQILLNLVEGSGFQETSSGGPVSPVFQAAICTAFGAADGIALNRLFNLLTYTLTEFFISVKESDFTHLLAPNELEKLRKKLMTLLDLCRVLARLLEFLSQQNPACLVNSPLHLTRVAETVAFVLNQSTSKACMCAVLSLNTILTRAFPGRPDQLSLIQLQAPVVGIVYNLFMAEEVANTKDPETRRRAAFWDTTGRNRAIVEALASSQVVLHHNCLDLIRPEAWPVGLSSDPIPLEDATRVRQLDRIAKALAAAMARSAGVETTEKQGPSVEEEDVPEEFFDPLVQTIMRDPVKLPDSRIVVDRFTIKRHLLSSANDPFTRSPLRLEDLRPDDALKARIEAWLDSRYPAAAQNAPAVPPDPSA
eukprot:jgi/Botrbrau1/22992/Bobra.0030s0056.1